MAPELGPPIVHLRPGLGPMARVAVRLFLFVVAIGGPWALWKGRTLPELANGLLAAGAVFALLPLLLALLVRPLGLAVHPAGLVGRTFWGRRELLLWEQIGEIREDDASGVTLLLIVARGDGPTIWTLPDVLAHPELQRLARQFGGERCPVVLAAPHRSDAHGVAPIG